ncbi:MAG: DUF2157 domain-containing protein [Leptolyngbyaceae cyanobacterium bins.302]|nr:DUF2157 domain-containing protein [Leptolyngbyaceae cyanobacterium bins.302]
MISERFRRELRQESEQWWHEGLIDAALYEKLAERYQFAQLEGEASNRFITILMGLGAVLLGLGAVTFVAANWQVWSRSLKLVLLLSSFVGVNAAGFYLWRKPKTQPGLQRLGHGLLLGGALFLGANLGLVSQMFHQSGDAYELFLIWGLGVTVMAYSLRLASLGVLSIILVTIAYFFSWGSSTVWQAFSGTSIAIQHLPLVLAGVFVPLAYWCRSRVIFGLSAIALAIAFVGNFKPYMTWSQGWLLAIAFVLPPALLWSYSDRLWHFAPLRHSNPHPSSPPQPPTPNPHPPKDPFQPISRSLALCFLSILFYVFAFHYWWQMRPDATSSMLVNWNWQPLLDAVILGIVAGLGWFQLRFQLFSRRPQERVVNTKLVAVLLLITAAVLIWHSKAFPVAPLILNVLLFALAIGLIRDGLALTQRSTFWGGMVLLVLGIVSRSLEYNTGLLLKSIVLLLCGVGVIAAGLWFERRLLPHRTTALPHSSQESP